MHITRLEPGEVFVFGSNASGAHGGGAARFALDRFGAVWGQSEGLQGQSYGIDTMSGPAVFEDQARRFVAFAADQHVAGFFAGAGENVELPESFRAALERG